MSAEDGFLNFLLLGNLNDLLRPFERETIHLGHWISKRVCDEGLDLLQALLDRCRSSIIILRTLTWPRSLAGPVTWTIAKFPTFYFRSGDVQVGLHHFFIPQTMTYAIKLRTNFYYSMILVLLYLLAIFGAHARPQPLNSAKLGVRGKVASAFAVEITSSRELPFYKPLMWVTV